MAARLIDGTRHWAMGYRYACRMGGVAMWRWGRAERDAGHGRRLDGMGEGGRGKGTATKGKAQKV